MKRALISVSDKSGLVELAEELQKLGFQILTTGGSIAMLHNSGITATEVSEFTGFPEMLSGRVKTLHPAIHGGILARWDIEQHRREMQEQGLTAIDMVIVNFYPFEKALQQGADWEGLIENIDIGGPSMVRSAAKNHQFVTVVVDPQDYPEVVKQLRQNGEVSLKYRKELAVKALQLTAFYDALISSALTEYLQQKDNPELVFPEQFALALRQQTQLRYGENPHQQAALYRREPQKNPCLVDFVQLHGKPLSYNNIQDADSAWKLLFGCHQATVVAVKHCNPCGIGQDKNLITAWQKAHDSDPQSIFGGIIACNRTVSVELAEKIAGIFIEVVMAPDFDPAARQILQKKANIRLLKLPSSSIKPVSDRLTSIDGGLLYWKDLGDNAELQLQLQTGTALTASQRQDAILAWQTVALVKSNAIVLVKDGATVGIGAGQMSRVAAVRIALQQAAEKAKGAVMASDAFFPFADAVELAAAAGVKVIVQPGGSIRDNDSLTVCQQHQITMLFTGKREFNH